MEPTALLGTVQVGSICAIRHPGHEYDGKIITVEWVDQAYRGGRNPLVTLHGDDGRVEACGRWLARDTQVVVY